MKSNFLVPNLNAESLYCLKKKLQIKEIQEIYLAVDLNVGRGRLGLFK